MAAAGSRLVALAAIALAAAGCTTARIDERTFDGTRWHVTAIDRQPTPATGEYQVQFSGRNIGGRFGCNGFGGSYGVIGNIMTAGEIRSTMMACSEPAAGFESRGFAVLRLPMQMQWATGRHLILANSAGSIELEQVP